jgi:hypothetical protein
MPATKVCMNCHQQIWVGSPMLQPVRDSFAQDESIPWQRVHRLADFVYFNHSVHVNKGIGCSTCHGPVNQMPLMYQHGSLLMEWCLDCHRQPDQFVRPKKEIYNMDWKPSEAEQANLGPKLRAAYQLRSLLNCSTCHR